MSKPNPPEPGTLEHIESIDITKYPITTNAYSWTPMAIIMNLFLHVFSLMLPSVMILTFYSTAMRSSFAFWWRIILVFIDIMAWWGLYILLSLFIGKLFLIILELIHKPKEGLFKIDKRDPDYYYYCLRMSVKKFIFWVWNNYCFPWASNLAFKVCNMKADFKSTMFDGWSDLEFVEFGNNIMLGQGAVILTSMVIGDHLLLKKVVVGDHVVIGGNAIVAPGTIIGKGATLGVWATTHINQVLEPDYIYIGRPARKYKHALTNLEDSRKTPVRRMVDTNERVEHKINYIIKKGRVEIIVDKLDAMYQKWVAGREKKKYKKIKKKKKTTYLVD